MLSQVLFTAFSFSDSSYFVGIACSDCFRRLLEVNTEQEVKESKILQFRQQSKLQNWESVEVYGEGTGTDQVGLTSQSLSYFSFQIRAIKQKSKILIFITVWKG